MGDVFGRIFFGLGLLMVVGGGIWAAVGFYVKQLPYLAGLVAVGLLFMWISTKMGPDDPAPAEGVGQAGGQQGIAP